MSSRTYIYLVICENAIVNFNFSLLSTEPQLDIYRVIRCFLFPVSFRKLIMLCLIFGLFALAAASSTKKTTFVPKGAKCQDYTIPVTVTSENQPWIGPRWTDNYELADFVSTSSARVSAGFPIPVGDPVNQTASYNIAATFCTPERPGEHSKTVLLATHGVGLDRT